MVMHIAHRHFGDILAICDVDKDHADKVNAEDAVASGKADVYGDYRKVLERSDIDVVSVVTPDHWHVKIAIEALQAGKHVFCQKPLTLTLEENQLIRNACRKYADRVFFVGTQQRSDDESLLRAVNLVRQGLIGDVQKITVGINGGDVGGPFVSPIRRRIWTGTCGWDRHHGLIILSSAVTVIFAGGMNTQVENSPTGAHIILILRNGQSVKTAMGPGPSKLTGRMQNTLYRTKTVIR